jgi:hypothetical protein
VEEREDLVGLWLREKGLLLRKILGTKRSIFVSNDFI